MNFQITEDIGRASIILLDAKKRIDDANIKSDFWIQKGGILMDIGAMNEKITIQKNKKENHNKKGRKINSLFSHIKQSTPLLMNEVLCFSHKDFVKSTNHKVRFILQWWAIGDSNPGPTGYEPGALTN